MTETTVNRVAELYKEKSELLDELSTLLGENKNFIIGYSYKKSLAMHGSFNFSFSTISQSFLAEIKKLTEVHIKNRIEEIDIELKDL